MFSQHITDTVNKTESTNMTQLRKQSRKEMRGRSSDIILVSFLNSKQAVDKTVAAVYISTRSYKIGHSILVKFS